MSFTHINAVAEADVPYKASAAWIYNQQDEVQVYIGFTDTQELIAWMNRPESEGDSVCMSGEWEVDDDGNTCDMNDSWELTPGDTWAGFKREYQEFLGY